MKLEFPQVDVKSSRAFEDENFALGDVRVIMNLLSSKIYARPKYIIIQEVASNARDANREAGIPDTPVTIKLPNRFDDNLRIRDSGPGISPSRMSDVFLKYGNSTKRVDNVQTGGFGIGAKTPFTYTDTFNVVTVTDDEDGRHRRTYIAHKASDGMAKMALVTTEKVDNSVATGTEISFAVQKKDFDSFIQATADVCRFWSPRPNIEGYQGEWEWDEDEVLHTGQGWTLAKHGDPLVLVDGIPYKLRLEAIFTDTSVEEYKVLSRTAIRMHFNVGDVEVSATREDLDYSDKTVETVKKRAAQCLKELRAKVNQSIAQAQNLWDASIQWREKSSGLHNFLVEPTWNGYKLLPGALEVPYSIDTKKYPVWFAARKAAGKVNPNRSWDSIDMREHIKITIFEEDNGSILSRKQWGRAVDRRLVVADNYLVVEDDIRKARPNRLRLQTLFEQNPDKSYIAVVVNKTQSDDANQFLEHVWNWSQIPKVMLSTVPKAKNARKNGGKAYTVNAVKVLRRKPGGRSWTKEWQGDKDRAPEDDKGGLFVILKDGKPTLSNGKVLSKDTVAALSRELEQEVYGILYKYRNKVSDDWTGLLEFVTARNTAAIHSPSVQNHIRLGTHVASNTIGHYLYDELTKRIAEIDSPEVKKWLTDSALSNAGEDEYDTIRSLYIRIAANDQVPELGDELSKLSKKLSDAAPLLSKFRSMGRYELSSNGIVDEIIFYINQRFPTPSADGTI